MGDIVERLKASIRFDAMNGDAHERGICETQMVEAVAEIERLHATIMDAAREIERLRLVEHSASRSDQFLLAQAQQLLDLNAEIEGLRGAAKTQAETIDNLTTNLRIVREDRKALTEELAETYDSVMRQDGYLVGCRSDDDENFKGWWDSQCRSHVVFAGDRLVELGLWEIHPDGVGRRQFYRPKTQEDE